MKKNSKFAILFVTVPFVLLTFIVSQGMKKGGWQSDTAAEITTGQSIPYETKFIPVADVHNSHNLWLVNEEHEVSTQKKVETVPAYLRVALSRSDITLNSEALEKVEEMFREAQYDYIVTSGFRTLQRQTELFEDALDKSYVALPRHSEHQTGLAIDIQLNSKSLKDLGNTREGKWLVENSYRFGFILRYPEDKIDLTKISYESWHFRYVGIPHAYFMKEHNFCLEEYIQWLKKNKYYDIVAGKNKYRVFYTSSKNDMIKVPVCESYELSDDNTGGYIITQKVTNR